MLKKLLRAIPIFCCLFLLVAAGAVCFASGVSEVAWAESIDVSLNLTYDEEADFDVHQILGKEVYYKIVRYEGSSDGGATLSLTTDGKVTAKSAEYTMDAYRCAVFCDQDGSNPKDCSGTIRVTVFKRDVTAFLDPKTLTKVYGEEGADVPWYEDPNDRENGLQIVFSSVGISAEANAGQYPLFVKSFTQEKATEPMKEDPTDYYAVETFLTGGAERAIYTVLPKEIELLYREEAEVLFNDYDEDCVTTLTLEQDGVVLTACFCLAKGHPDVLSVGCSYPIELSYYTVTKGDEVTTVYVTRRETPSEEGQEPPLTEEPATEEQSTDEQSTDEQSNEEPNTQDPAEQQAAGEKVAYDNVQGTDDPAAFDYLVSVVYEVTTVKAKAGTVILHQDETAHEGDQRYFRLPLSALEYAYLDLACNEEGAILDLRQEDGADPKEDESDPQQGGDDLQEGGEQPQAEQKLLSCKVTLYDGVTATLRLALKTNLDKAGVIPAGRYAVTLIDWVCDDVDDLLFDEGDSVFLVVAKRKLEKEVTGAEEVQFGLSDTYEKQVVISYLGEEYTFTVSADLRGKKAGDADIPYTAFLSQDPNLEVDLKKVTATVSIVKRTEGVGIDVPEKVTVSYPAPAKLDATVLLTERGVSRPLTQEDGVTLTCRTVGQSAEGLPKGVGAFKVVLTVESDNYAASREIAYTVTKRAVAAKMQLKTSVKTYGETFDFSAKNVVGIQTLYSYDEVTRTENREEEVPFDAGKDFSGTILASDGAAASASVGEYQFDYKRLSSAYFDVKKIIVYDVAAGKEVSVFTVKKAIKPSAPPAPTCNAVGNELVVTADLPVCLELSRKETMDSPDRLSEKTLFRINKVGTASLLCGETVYLRAYYKAGGNYEQDGDYCDVVKVVLPFAAPSVELSEVGSDKVTFVLDPLPVGTVKEYVVRYRVDSGAWKDGFTVTGLSPNRSYNLFVRLEKDGVIGAERKVSFKTLRAPLSEDALEIVFDRATGSLSVETEEKGLEYSLYSSTGEMISAWSSTPSFESILADSTYLLKVRYAEDGGEFGDSPETEIEIDTHKKKEPFTLGGFLSDWFLVIVGAGLLLLCVLFIVIFVKKKNKAIGKETKR